MATYVGQVALLSRRGLDEMRSVAWDCTLTEGHGLSNDITDHAVEDGASVSDHIRRKPDMLTIEGLLTDSPLTGDSTVVEFVPGRAAALYEQLRQLAVGQVFTVATSIRDYDSMAIAALDVPVSLATGQGLRFSLHMKQIRIVRTKIVSLPTTNLPRAKPKQKTGSYVPKFVTTANAYMILSQQSPSVFADGLVTPQPDYIGSDNVGASGSGGL